MAMKNAVFVADRFAQMGLRKELTAAVARHNALWDGARLRRRPRGPYRDAQPHRRHRTRGAAQDADQRRPLARWSTRPTAGSSSAPESASATSWTRRWRRAISPPRRAQKACRAAGVEPSRRRLHHRRHGDAATARSPPPRRSCRRSWARGRAAARSICRRRAPASSTACRSPTASSGPGSSRTCWSSASRCSRASSTGPTARTCVLFGDGAGAVLMAADAGGVRGRAVDAPVTPTAR